MCARTKRFWNGTGIVNAKSGVKSEELFCFHRIPVHPETKTNWFQKQHGRATDSETDTAKKLAFYSRSSQVLPAGARSEAIERVI